ncbi:hypothetical protein DyAD56_16195 [Dyella sp. AD56]|uniref:hypothetical protein n=1 Tax=Dyella sp. AD56 TaxID=1528744 RepID=UPI000C84545C|nr:hypothetical protein [Dyella sp. AD56]PMQ04229.1 hypothetical protein DyAD56_16195 [Dyella sp. AD56]
MIGPIEVGTLQNSIISAVAHEGLIVTTRDGLPARIAIIDEHGNVIEAGEAVAEEAWNVAIASYKNFLQGMGHISVHTKPPGLSD